MHIAATTKVVAIDVLLDQGRAFVLKLGIDWPMSHSPARPQITWKCLEGIFARR